MVSKKNLKYNLRFFFQEFIQYKRRRVYALTGALISLGSPLGWLLLSILSEYYQVNISLMTYMTLSTMCVFSAFGYVVGFFHDKVRALADSDLLTGLLNQVSFYQITTYLYDLAIRKKENIAILMMDIDYFKNVNDQNNHLTGSYVLTEIAKILRSMLRKSDAVARFGGDEFIIFLSNVNESYVDVAERIRKKIETHTFLFQDFQVKITISIGAVKIQANSNYEIKELVTLADKALYKAKNQGRNRLEVAEINKKSSISNST